MANEEFDAKVGLLEEEVSRVQNKETEWINIIWQSNNDSYICHQSMQAKKRIAKEEEERKQNKTKQKLYERESGVVIAQSAFFTKSDCRQS